MTDKPSRDADFYDYLSPWATAERIERQGIAIVCASNDDWCLGKLGQYLANNPAGRRADVTLTPHWLGFAGNPKSFVIATVPPR